VHFDVAIDRRQCSLLGAVVANSRVDAALFVVESLDTTSMKHHSLWAAMLIGAFVISASDFSAACGVRRAVLKFTAAVKFWRRVFITDMFKKKHPKLVDLVCKMSQKADSQWEVLDTLEAINAEWRSVQKKGKSGQVVVLGRANEKLQTRAKVMKFAQFQTSINKVDAARTVSSSESARVR